jgi:branched-chain amino acid transport system ATP-binding protein
MTVAVRRPLFEMDDVSASYSSYRALFNVSLSVPERGILALLGSNGAGKSTLARVATGLVPTSSGAIRLDGLAITGLPAHKIARLGVAHVPEGRGLFASLTVEENLTLGFRQKLGRAGVSGALERAYTAFPVLAERRRQMGGTLSGGQQRMLSLARVLATSPRVLVVDELSLGLAPVVIDAVYEGLLTVRDSGCAIIVVEQQVDRALAIADDAVLLAHGSVAWAGPAGQASAAMDALLSSRHQAIEDSGDTGRVGPDGATAMA